jgi:RNA polymerase sigma-70 factor, ECF subfamily
MGSVSPIKRVSDEFIPLASPCVRNKPAGPAVVDGAEPEYEDVRSQLGQFIPRLRRFAQVLTRSQADADDLVQSTLERALMCLEQWERGTRLDSWLYRIAQNLWIDQRRAARLRGTTESADAAMQLIGEDGRELNERHLMIRDAIRALAALPEDQQAVLALVSIEGLPYSEAAKVLGIPIGTVMSRLARGRRAIAARVLGTPLDRHVRA